MQRFHLPHRSLPRQDNPTEFLEVSAMDYVPPGELLSAALAAASKKAQLSVFDMLVRGFLAGAILAYATSLAFVVLTQGLAPVVAAILFPVGFVILVLLGLELATGNFALLPAGLAAGQVSFPKLLRNWFWVYAGNLAGSLFYGVLFYAVVTNFNSGSSGALGELFKTAAQKKTLGYMSLGFRGWETAFVKGLLCNWMVTLGAVLALVSRSIVNMFVIPTGKFFGAPVSLSQWWVWNQIPVTLGNIVSGALLTGVALYVTYKPREQAALTIPVPLAQQNESSLQQATVAG